MNQLRDSPLHLEKYEVVQIFPMQEGKLGGLRFLW